MKIPVLDLELKPPTRGSVAWYAGVGTMSALGLVEWPVAAIIAAGHFVSENSRSAVLTEAIEGAESTGG